MKQIQSPCNLVCSIDIQTGFCFGCGRTGIEIGNWALYDDQSRLDIMSGLEARMETIVRRPRRITRRSRMKQKSATNSSRN